MLAGQMELARLVDLAAQRLGLNIEYDTTVVKGNATLRFEAGVSDADLWNVTNRVLVARGLTTVRMPGDRTYSVVKLTDAAAVVLPDPRGSEGPEPGYACRLVHLHVRAATELVEDLGRACSKPAGSVAVIGPSSLLVCDLTERLPYVEQVAALLDQPRQSAAVEEVGLTNLSGVQMAALVTQVMAKRDLATGKSPQGEVIAGPDPATVLLVADASQMDGLRALVSQLDRRERLESVTYSPAHFPAKEVAALIEQAIRPPADDRFRAVVDDLTGAVIVTATPALHEQIAALMDRVNEVPESARRSVRTYVIRNRSAREMQATLEQLLARGILQAAAEDIKQPTRKDGVTLAPPPLTAKAPLLPQTPPSGSMASTSASVTLSADEHTNTLIAAGEPRLLAQIEALLATLDVRQSQVMLDVLIVTLTDSQTRDLGVELEQLLESGGTFIRLASLFGLGTVTNGQLNGPTSAAGFTGVVLSPGDYSVVLRALETVSHGRSLSMPSILVGNNQPAQLDAVVQQPFASVNASNTVSTTSFGGTQDAGTSLTITPQIAEGDHLLLEYSISLSTFLGAASSPTLPPARQQNQISSVSTIPDGYTVVVGGIDLYSQSRSVAQIPLLGRIPVLGEAFKSRNRTEDHSKFYVFIRANILRDNGFEMLKYLSDRQVSDADLDTGWPTVQPQVIR